MNENKLLILIDDVEQNNDIKGGWATEIKNKTTTVNIEPSVLKESLSAYVKEIYEVLEQTDTSDKYCIDSISLKFGVTKNGEIALAGIISGEMGNSTTIEVQIKRK